MRAATMHPWLPTLYMFACVACYRCHESEHATLVTVCVVAHITVYHHNIAVMRMHLLEICSTD